MSQHCRLTGGYVSYLWELFFSVGVSGVRSGLQAEGNLDSSCAESYNFVPEWSGIVKIGHLGRFPNELKKWNIPIPRTILLLCVQSK